LYIDTPTSSRQVEQDGTNHRRRRSAEENDNTTAINQSHDDLESGRLGRELIDSSLDQRWRITHLVDVLGMCCLDRSIQAVLDTGMIVLTELGVLFYSVVVENLPVPSSSSSSLCLALPPKRTNLRSLPTPPAPPDPHSFQKHIP
jgi:hypothetical protein